MIDDDRKWEDVQSLLECWTVCTPPLASNCVWPVWTLTGSGKSPTPPDETAGLVLSPPPLPVKPPTPSMARKVVKPVGILKKSSPAAPTPSLSASSSSSSLAQSGAAAAAAAASASVVESFSHHSGRSQTLPRTLSGLSLASSQDSSSSGLPSLPLPMEPGRRGHPPTAGSRGNGSFISLHELVVSSLS